MAYDEVDDETYDASEAQDAGAYPGVAEQFFPEEPAAGVVSLAGAEPAPLPELPPEETPVAARAPSDQQDAPRSNVGPHTNVFAKSGSQPDVPAAAPEILTPQQLMSMLDSGF